MIIDFNEVKSIWSKNIRPVVLYLNNPFCRGGKEENNCKYCVHRGCVKRKEDETVDKFYFEEIPKRIEQYLPIINNQNIKLISFGGGTPNYLSVEKLNKYFSLLIKKIPSFVYYPKFIELHPAYITKDLIYLLKDYNFTNLIFCFQTFDQNILDNQNRINCDYNNIKECRQLAKDLGMEVGCDIITMWSNNIKEWQPILIEDLKKVKELDMDEITISPLYQMKYSVSNTDVSYEYIREAVNTILSEYYNPEMSLYSKYYFTIRLFKKEKNYDNWKTYIHSLTEFSWEGEQGISTLGIGNYNNGNKCVYSIIGPNYTIYERTNNFDVQYDLIKKYNFWDSARNVIDALQKQFGDIEIPVGTELVLKNICERANDTADYDDFKQGNCLWKFEDDYSISNSEIEKKIKNNFNEKLENIDKKEIRDYNIRKGENNV